MTNLVIALRNGGSSALKISSLRSESFFSHEGCAVLHRREEAVMPPAHQAQVGHGMCTALRERVFMMVLEEAALCAAATVGRNERALLLVARDDRALDCGWNVSRARLGMRLVLRGFSGDARSVRGVRA